MNRAYAQTISGAFYDNNRFPAYCYDKIICGLMDSHNLAHDPDAYHILEATSDTALPHLPGKAVEHGRKWRLDKDESWTQDESYTCAENLFLAYQRGTGARYRSLAQDYLDDEYFDPLAAGHSNLEGRQAYSHVNALCSAMQAYLTLGSEKHLRAARNGFDFLAAQSFATGGWGADEILRAPDSDAPYASLTASHDSFETPCGSYAHFKLTRYLLRATRDARYGDSMERVMYNTVLGAKPLHTDGRTFYYSDYNFAGRKVYFDRLWACCGVYVNLYVPSTLRWTDGNHKFALRQISSYPLGNEISLQVTASQPFEFSLRLRIPACAEGATIAVNGKRIAAQVLPGQFADIRRQWKTGDRVELHLPLKTRLEAIHARHSDTVALLAGPLVLFPITGANSGLPPAVTRAQLLAVRQTHKNNWQAQTIAGPLELRPFTAIEDESYSTYLRVA